MSLPKTVQPGKPKLPEPPSGWAQSPLGDHLIEIRRPAKLADDDMYSLVTVKRARGGVVKRADMTGKEISVKSQFYLEPDDFLVSKRQIVHGACGVVPEELAGSIVSNEYSVFNCRDTFDLDFLKYLSHSVYFQQTCFHSSIGVHVEKLIFKVDQWLRWNFNVPPLAEQKNIARILSTWDEAISVSEKLLENSEAQKKALLQQLLTGKRRLPGFSKKWSSARLGSCTNCLDNKRVPLNSEEREHMRGDVPYYGANGVVDHINKHIFNQDLVLLAEDGGYFDEFAERPIAQLISGKSWVNNHAHILSAKPITSERWIYFSLVHKNILAFINAGTRSKLNKSDMLAIPIFLPSKDEQDAITDVLTCAWETVEKLKRNVQNLRAERDALMQQLLTGKRRVKLDGGV